ncbi:MAG TPA: hypothetical protein VFK10_21635 [Burkholderiaceae bacterium]|nr:hypothetical protein [Burkholderiaceae bacterium]
MSFFSDVVGVVSKAVETVAPMALAAVFPPAAMLGPLSNIATNLLTQGLGQAIGQLGQQCGIASFVMKEAQQLLQGIAQQLQQPADPGCSDHVSDKAGGIDKDLVDQIVNDFKDMLQNYKNEQAQKGQCGGKGGKGGAGGAGGAGSSGTIGFRELAEILAGLEQKEAQNVANSAKKAGDALGVAKSGAKGDEQKDADIAADQFRAMEANKAEAQIFQALSSAISEVMKNFGGALQTAARG